MDGGVWVPILGLGLGFGAAHLYCVGVQAPSVLGGKHTARFSLWRYNWTKSFYNLSFSPAEYLSLSCRGGAQWLGLGSRRTLTLTTRSQANALANTCVQRIDNSSMITR